MTTDTRPDGLTGRLIEAAIAPYRNDSSMSWTRVRTSLEDVFIEFMAQAQDRNQ